MGRSTHDSNSVPTMIGVDEATFTVPTEVAVNSTTHAMLVSATIDTSAVATSANQTNGSQKTQIVDSLGNGVTVTGNKLDVNATATLAKDNLPISGATAAVGVAIVDGSGNQITSFGGGTQYANGFAVATPTGTTALGFDGSNVRALLTDTSGLLKDNLTQVGGASFALGQQLAAASLPVVLTAAQLSTLTPPAALTNFALETGGNLAAVKTNTDKIPSLGQALAAGSVPVVLTAAQLSTLTPLSSVTVTQGTGTNLHTVVDSGVINADLRVGGNAVTTTNPVAIQPPASGHLHIDGDGVAGTPATGVVTVQGITSMTPIQVSQATASNLNATVVGTGTFATQSTLQTQTDTTMVGGVNVKEINGVAPLMGNGVSGTGAQRVTLASDDTVYDSVADTGNSTVSTLLANAVFTGTGFDLTPYASWSVTIFSNVASAASGLSVQWSEDNSNWDFSDAQTYAAGVGNTITFGRKAKYVRLVYTNGGTNQTSFRVQATAQKISVRQTRKFVGNAIVNQDTAQIVTAALQGLSTAGGGTWVPVKVSPAGAMTAAVTAADGDVFVRSNAAATFPVTAVQGTGTNLHTVTDTGSTTAVTQATASNLNATVVGTGTFAVQAAATLAAETTKVIGTVRNADGAGNLLTTNSTTYTAKFGLDSNLLGTLGTAFSTAGKVDVKGADGDVFVRQTTASNLNATVVQGTGTNLHTVVDSGTITTVTGITNQVDTNLKQVGGTNTVTGGANGSLGVGGTVATNVAITDNPLNLGAQAISAENTAVTATRKVQLVADLTGKLITSPHANKENFVSGIAAPTTATDTEVIAAPAAGLYIYVTSISVANTGTTTSLMTIETDTASAKTAMWYLIAPAGGGDNITFDPPLRTTATAKNVGVKTASASTTMYCSIAGFIGT